jgi:Ser/Thr protein kinase RdoA (MazF antagonist)
MEHIVDSSNAVWTVDQYAFAAHELGRFNGRCFVNNSLPDYPWLCKGYVPTKTDPWPPHHAWENPFVSQAFSDQTHDRILRLWDERTRFYDALERLPQTFSHYDFHRRNILIRRQEDGSDQIVAIDWAWAGYGALGADLYSVVGGSALVFELEAADVAEAFKLTRFTDISRLTFKFR